MNDTFFRHIHERFYRQNVNFNKALKLYISQSPHVDIATQPKHSAKNIQTRKGLASLPILFRGVSFSSLLQLSKSTVNASYC